MENNSANGKYVQRHLPPEAMQLRSTCCSDTVCNTSPSLYNSVSCCILYGGHQCAACYTAWKRRLAQDLWMSHCR